MDTFEERGVREMISETMDRLQRASAGPDDIGSRYARLLDLLWKPKTSMPVATEEPQRNSEISISETITNSAPESTYMRFSPANDFSWLDLEAVGDYVSGDHTAGANISGFSSFQGVAPYTPGQEGTIWPTPYWATDLNGNLPF